MAHQRSTSGKQVGSNGGSGAEGERERKGKWEGFPLQQPLLTQQAGARCLAIPFEVTSRDKAPATAAASANDDNAAVADVIIHNNTSCQCICR